MARVAKLQIEKLAYYPTLSRQMYKRKVQTLSGASFESTCSKLKKHIPGYIVQEKHFWEYKKYKITKQIQLQRKYEREQQNQINLT